MATVASDDFNRADGALGSPWVVSGTEWDISTNRLRMHSSWATLKYPCPEGAQSDGVLSLQVASGHTFSGLVEQYVRWNSTTAVGYRVWWLFGALGSAKVTIEYSVANSWIVLATASNFALLSGTPILSVRYAGTLIEALLDGSVVASVSDSHVGSGGEVGFRGNNADAQFFDNFGIYDTIVAGLSVSPFTCLPEQVGLTLNLTGLVTDWTAGVPGSPTFTVSAGTITYQHILSATTATLTYDAPATAQTVVLTDPDSGATANIYITTNPTLPPGGVTDPLGLLAWLQDLSDTLIDMLNDAADALQNGETLDEGESVLKWVRYIGNPTPYGTLAAILADVLDHLANDHDDPTTLRSVVVDILTELYTTNGYPTRVTLPDLSSAIGALGSPDYTEITDAISGVADQIIDVATTLNTLAGTPVTSTADLLSAIGGVSTDVGIVGGTADSIETKLDAATGSGAYSLGGVMAAFGGVGVAQLLTLAVGIIGLVRGGATTALQVIDAVQDVIDAEDNLPAIVSTLFGFLDTLDVPTTTTLAVDLGSVISDIAAVSSDLSTGVGTLSDAITGLGTDLGSQLTAMDGKLDDILEALSASAGGGAQWPGLADVTLGTPVAITSAMRLEETCEGFIYNITGYSSAARTSTIGGKTSVQALGLAAFESDNGDVERFQTLSFTKGVIVPKSMLSASACVLQWRAGTTGTVTTWVRTVA